jgi:hypothetical protein
MLDTLAISTPEPHDILFICSPHDHVQIATIAEAGAPFMVLDELPRDGDYARKINAAYRATDHEWFFTGADDLLFHPGWLADCGRFMGNRRHGVIGTQDLGNRRVIMRQHSTHSLVRRSYIDRWGTIDEPGKVLYEGYAHNFCDDELVGTAKLRDAWIFATNATVEHLHPMWGKCDTDDIYTLGGLKFHSDQELYRKRRRLWVG